MSDPDEMHTAICWTSFGVFLGSVPWLHLWAIPIAIMSYGLTVFGAVLFFALQRTFCPKPTTED